ncbi:MAG: patatin-like phospholipase family protein [Tissierellia bacterium]|nr:patatin-like phospholipase family protein [Tissierellia bacterium]
MYGLVLEGGGARGAYHIGAYKAIKEEGIEIGGIAGTSVGAINGAMIVQGDYELAYELWQEISFPMVISTNDEEVERLRHLRLDKEDLSFLVDKVKDVINDGGLDITPLKNLLNTYIDEDRIRSSDMDFGIVTVNLTDFKSIEVFKEEIPKGKIKDYILASSYLPSFKKEKLDGKRYLDGAFYDNLPFKLLQSKGYEDLIFVRTNARGLTRKLKDKANAIVISPSEELGNTLDFDKEIAKRNLQLGYYDGLKVLRGLKGNKYYIQPKGEDYYFDLLTSIDENKLNKLRGIIRTRDVPDKRAIFEYIIPKLASALGLERNFDYEDFILALLEKRAESLDIDVFQIYSYEDLLQLVKQARKNSGIEDKGNSLISAVASLFNKDETILKVVDIILNIS